MKNYFLLGLILVSLALGYGLSWPDGRQAIVTFWKAENSVFRCIDYFDTSMQSTGGGCYSPAKE
jgi:hypothetical protein